MTCTMMHVRRVNDDESTVIKRMQEVKAQRNEVQKQLDEVSSILQRCMNDHNSNVTLESCRSLMVRLSYKVLGSRHFAQHRLTVLAVLSPQVCWNRWSLRRTLRKRIKEKLSRGSEPKLAGIVTSRDGAVSVTVYEWHHTQQDAWSLTGKPAGPPQNARRRRYGNS